MTVCVLGIFLWYLRLRTNIEKVLRDSQRPLTMITLRSVDVWPCHKPLLLFHLYILSHSGSNKERPVWCWMLMLCLEWEKRNVQCVWHMNFMRRTIWPEHMGNYIIFETVRYSKIICIVIIIIIIPSARSWRRLIASLVVNLWEWMLMKSTHSLLSLLHHWWMFILMWTSYGRLSVAKNRCQPVFDDATFVAFIRNNNFWFPLCLSPTLNQRIDTDQPWILWMQRNRFAAHTQWNAIKFEECTSLKLRRDA